jgi:hypothetical protein
MRFDKLLPGRLPLPLRPSDECEIAAEFEEECFELGDKRAFELGLGVFAFEVEELEDVRLLDLFRPGDAHQEVHRESGVAFPPAPPVISRRIFSAPKQVGGVNVVVPAIPAA